MAGVCPAILLHTEPVRTKVPACAQPLVMHTHMANPYSEARAQTSLSLCLYKVLEVPVVEILLHKTAQA